MSPTQSWQDGGKFSLSYLEESLPALQGFTEVLWSLRHLGRVLWFLVFAVTCMVPQE